MFITFNRQAFRLFASVFFVFFTALVLSGCVTAKGQSYVEASAQIPELSQDKARIYVLRKSMFTYSLATAQIHVNGAHELNVASGGYAYMDVEPGELKLEVNTNSDDRLTPSQVKVYPGEELFLGVVLNEKHSNAEMMIGVLAHFLFEEGIFALVKLPQQEAMELLPNLRETL